MILNSYSKFYSIYNAVALHFGDPLERRRGYGGLPDTAWIYEKTMKISVFLLDHYGYAG
jgi:hypothetical protein